MKAILLATLLLIQTPQSPGWVSVQGTVTSAVSERLVEGALVLLTKVEVLPGKTEATSVSIGPLPAREVGRTMTIPILGSLKDAYSATTDVAGVFVFRNIAP